MYCPGSINLKPFARTSAEDFMQDFSQNVVGAVRSLQVVAPLLKNPQPVLCYLAASLRR